MMAGFYPGQSSSLRTTPIRPPPMAGQTAQSGQMVVCLDQPVPLSVVPSTFVPSHSNVTDTAPLLTQMQFQGVFFSCFGLLASFSYYVPIFTDIDCILMEVKIIVESTFVIPCVR
jgi:hypothetical protein